MLDHLYERVKKDTNRFLAVLFEEKMQTEDADMRNLIPVLRDYCLGGGKRLRAYLAIIGYTALGGRQVKKMIAVASALELLHAAVLIHDDIIDHDDERRGKPSLHNVLHPRGELRATFASDILTAWALEALAAAEFDAATKQRAGKILNHLAIQTGVGQAMDILYSFQDTHPKDTIAKIIHLKTSQYTTTGPLLLGAIFAGATDEELMPLRRLGDDLGAAFQLHDDYLGVFGKGIGKPLFSDIREGKPTFILTSMEERLSHEDYTRLKKLFAKRNLTKRDIKLILTLMQKTKAGEMTLTKIQRHVNGAKRTLETLKIPRSVKKRFELFANYLLSRPL